MNDLTAKIIDFGVSQKYDPNVPNFITETAGTYQFMPPESCDPEIEKFSGILSDVWALGVTMFCMAFNRLPFSGGNEYLIMENIRTNPVVIPVYNTA